MGFVTGSETTQPTSQIMGTWFPISPDFKLACEGSHDIDKPRASGLGTPLNEFIIVHQR